MSGEVYGCQQIDIDRHRWYVNIRITDERGNDFYKFYAATSDGICEFDSEAEMMEALEG